MYDCVFPGRYTILFFTMWCIQWKIANLVLVCDAFLVHAFSLVYVALVVVEWLLLMGVLSLL